MHELGMCQAVLDKVEHHAQGRPVAAVGVQVGHALAVEPDVFAQGFAVLARGGVADGAGVAITAVDGDGLVLEWLRYREAAAPAAATGG